MRVSLVVGCWKMLGVGCSLLLRFAVIAQEFILHIVILSVAAGILWQSGMQCTHLYCKGFLTSLTGADRFCYDNRT